MKKLVTRRDCCSAIGAISALAVADSVCAETNILHSVGKLQGKQLGDSGTFALNKVEPIHRWYSYLEGYSSVLIEELFDELSDKKIKSVYDPFGGTGTTMLVAAMRGIKSYYTESNPFMCEVVEAKINHVISLVQNKDGRDAIKAFLKRIRSIEPELFEKPAQTWDGFEHFFDPVVLSSVLDLKRMIADVRDKDAKAILRVALASVIVRASLMIRRGDLRKAREGEKDRSDFDVVGNLCKKVEEIISDIETVGKLLKEGTVRLGYDAREADSENLYDAVITSPPYLNGTNYIRNTKLELKVCDYLKTEADMSVFHAKGIVAGINNVSKKKNIGPALPCVAPYIEKLAPVAYDQRIPEMVKGYFNDMRIVLSKVAKGLKDGGYFIMDIGDSQFAGVHIPTHDILAEIAKEFGFEKYEEKILRSRVSKNGMKLTQRLLKFKLDKSKQAERSFREAAVSFMSELRYRTPPYNGRNWGHQWHSLCSYHGKLKPSIAHLLVSEFTKPGQIVLDPMSGVGTIPFEACLQGRIGIGNDLSEMAYVVSRAKLERSDKEDVEKVLAALDAYIKKGVKQKKHQKAIEAAKDFGYNKTLREYFHEKTLAEIVVARSYFVGRIGELTSSECLVMAAFLHVLHGNRPYALSRTSHPLTPYAPTGEFVYKNVVEHIREKVASAYSGKVDFSSYERGRAILGDFALLPAKGVRADWIICSPPFADSIRFYMQNWMRLWLCGWEKSDFDAADERFLDVRQKDNFDLYIPFFKMAHAVLKPKGRIILHLGKTEKVDMARELMERARSYFNEVYSADESVVDVEKHGVKDKGGTIAHQFLFLEKRP